MRNRLLVRVLLGTAAFGLMAAPALAQSSNDVSVGYSFLRLIAGGEGLNIPAGWNLSLAGGVSETVSVVSDFGGHYKSIEGDSRIHTFQGGVRFSARRTSNVVPFGQVLVGGAYGFFDGEVDFVGAVQFGAGVDVFSRGGGPGFRAQVDARSRDSCSRNAPRAPTNSARRLHSRAGRPGRARHRVRPGRV